MCIRDRWGDGPFRFAALDWFAVVLFAAALVVLRKWKPNPIYVMVACGVVEMCIRDRV